MTDYQYGLSSIQDNRILQQIITERKKMCESISDDPLSECFLCENIEFINFYRIRLHNTIVMDYNILDGARGQLYFKRSINKANNNNQQVKRVPSIIRGIKLF